MKKLIFLLLFIPFLVKAQTGTIGAITTHTKTGTVESEPPVPGTYDLYVDDSGNDASPGSQTEPFATFGKAASVAQPGDVIGVMGGTYRETIVPTNSGTASNPITFEGIPGQTVIVSGLNTVGTSWSVHSGNIYKTTITLPTTGYSLTSTSNTQLFANQIFKDGDMMYQARWPNMDTHGDYDDLLERLNNQDIVTSTSTTITDAAIPAGMTGGTVWINGWYITLTGTITGHSGSVITFSPGQSDALKRDRFHVTNKLALLDVAKEWHYESGILYLWQPGGGSPTGVEYKARNYGFDLRNKSYITINNIHFTGCNPVEGNTSTNNIIVDNIRATYINHTVVQGGSDIIYNTANQTGIKLIGSNNIIRNSEIQYAASTCVWLGEGGIMTNNLIKDIGYDGNYGAGVSFWGNTANQQVTYNTFERMGRSAVDFGPSDHGSHLNVEITMNDMSNFLMMNVDGGAVYAARHQNTTGWEVHHNWIHDSGVLSGEVGVPAFWTTGINTALYYDQGSGPSLNHHNVMWNNVQTDYFCQPNYTDRNAGPSNIYNNVFATVSSLPNSHSYKIPNTTPIDVQRNNIYAQDVIANFSTTLPDIRNSIGVSLPTSGTNNSNSSPSFVGSGTGGLAYRVNIGSPAINTGIAITGITTGSVGTPDMGAYENGGTEWVPGYVAVPIIPVSGDNDLDALGSVSPITVAFNTDFSSVGLPSTVS